MKEIKLQKDVILKGKFYLKSGAVLEESTTFKSDEDSYDDVNEVINEIIDTSKGAFRTGDSFVIWFGDAVIRGDDLSAFHFDIIEK